MSPGPPEFQLRCCLLTTGPLCHRCASTCLKTESKLAQLLQPRSTISLPGPWARRVTNLAILIKLLIKVAVDMTRSIGGIFWIQNLQISVIASWLEEPLKDSDVISSSSLMYWMTPSAETLTQRNSKCSMYF